MNVFGWSPQRTARRWMQGIVFAGASLASLAAVADVPGRVGRIAFMQGDVQAYSETEPEWKVAYINQPITSRNSVFVGDGGRAEISVGSTTLAIDGGSQVDIQQLDDNTFNANVVRGRVSLRVRRIDANDAYNVAAPGAVFALLQPGRYRVDALDTTTGITVFAGQASVDGGGNPTSVRAGNSVRVFASTQDPNGPPAVEYGAASAVALDDWVVGREQRFVASQSERYVSPNMTGYEDLDANGRWSTEADVGPVWYPTTYVRADWAPYRYGRWAYVAPWGYTWVDDAPWGFAPFHYGRWIEVGGRWGWCPGAYIARPVYAPALVGFYGGSGFSASFSIGAGPAVGWYPLAPWERFTPHYAHNTTYINQVNNITIVNAPRRFEGREGGWNREHGATVVPRDAFASQRSISRVAIEAPRHAFERGGPVNAGELPRPAVIPGAVRRGPELANGVARPEFRAPRDFAQRQPGRPGQTFDTANGPRTVDEQRGFERATRGNGREDFTTNGAVRPSPVPPGARPDERGQGYRGPNAPSFNREGRVQQQPIAPNAETVAPNPQSPNAERFNARQQAMQRGEAEAERVRQQAAERQPRDFRAPQPPQAPQAIPQPQPERPQQRFERPAPSQVQPQPQPQPRFERPQQPIERPVQVQPQPVERPQPQRFERPQQPVERPQPQFERPPQPQQQRFERPQPVEQRAAPVAPPAPVAQPRPQPQPLPQPQTQAAPPPPQGRPQGPGRPEGPPNRGPDREQAR